MSTTLTEAEIFRRIFESKSTMLTPAAAKSLLSLDFEPADRQRMNVLAEKARQGTLTKREDVDLEKYIFVGNLLGIMRSKARQFLGKKSAS